MRKNRIVSLNKIIYILLLIVLMEVGIVTMVSLFDKIISDYTETKKPTITKKSLALLSKKRVKKQSISSLPPKIENKVKKNKISFIKISPKNCDDVVEINTSLVKPIIYTNSVKLDEVSIAEKKKTFIDMLIPSILIAKYQLKEEKKHLKKLLLKEKLTAEERLWIQKKKYIFKASSAKDLYNKMALHPTSIIIAQAIIESGWGTSKFFEKANNVFGIWSFNEHEKRMAASIKRGKKTVYLKKYSSVEESIFDYFLVLSTKDAYKDFREKRLESQDPFVLIEHLGKYSELGQEYIENLKNTIQKNKLIAYDSYHLDI